MIGDCGTDPTGYSTNDALTGASDSEAGEMATTTARCDLDARLTLRPVSGSLETEPPEWFEGISPSEHVNFFKSTNWTASRLGPMSLWSNALRLYVHQVLADSRPAIIYWGPHKVAIYNEAFMPLAGKAHPSLMSARFEDGFPEIWDSIKPVFDGAEATKRAVDVIEIPLTVERSGYTEETYFTGNFNPLRGDSGMVEGFYNALGEVTRQKLNDRRRAMLNLISAPIKPYTTRTIGIHIVESLLTNTYDVPLALLYQVDDEATPGDLHLTLRGSLGIPRDHRLAIQHTTLGSEEGLMPLLRKAQSAVVTLTPGPEFGNVDWAGHGEPSKHISAMPLSNAGRLLGFLVIGTNPRRPIDDDHDQFTSDLARQLSSTIATHVSADEAVKRQQRLIHQLAERERQIRYMAQHLDIGMEHLALDGKVIWANEHYYTLIGHDAPKTENHFLPFKLQVLNEDQPKLLEVWRQTLRGERAQTIEIRMKRRFTPPLGDPVAATVLLSAFPYVEDGQVKSIMGCMTEVSSLKWAEAWQARAAREAQDAKRQQSEFTDAISHEVRNPLSAIFQLADGIIGSLEDTRSRCNSLHSCLPAIDENIEAARTILLCANHQKRIVDDVLTLSKMDLTLMTLSPTAVQPLDLAGGALKILEADLSANSINFSLIPESSLEDLKASWVLCDSLRVTQILINLLSNAIKFTKCEKRREITMRYGACISDPRRSLSEHIVWAASKQDQKDVTVGEEWGTGDSLYLTYLITDTGPGMNKEELERLFNRFEQASPRTSIKYGGSGLGLFISHSLSEKQNGSIGVSSEPGKGSTFAFYIKTRRLVTPPNQSPRSPSLGSTTPEQDLLKTERMYSQLALPDQEVQRSANASAATYHVLLVEDNVVNQRILKRQLTKAGCIVHVANHGLEALDMLRTSSSWKGREHTGHRLDVVLMDWEMPIMDGLTCSREIRALERSGDMRGHIEIIAVTANVRQEQVSQAMAAGVDDVMPKPFVVSDLLKTIKRRLGR